MSYFAQANIKVLKEQKQANKKLLAKHHDVFIGKTCTSF
jgi:hypothetical protein